jgi:hypothetical protein
MWRSQSNLSPIVVSNKGLAANCVAAPFDPELAVKKLSKEVLELRTEQALLKATIDSLNKVSLVEERPSKRRKAEEAPSKPPNKKNRSKRGKGKGKRGGQSGAQLGASGNKGKERQVPPPSSPANAPSGDTEWED